MFGLLYRLLQNRSGATAIEYGLIAALVSVAAIGGLQAVGVQVQTLFGDIAGVIQASIPGGST